MSFAPLLRSGLLAASESRALRAFAMKRGLRRFVRRFVAGEGVEDFVAEAARQNRGGRRVTAGYLGEGVGDRAAARRIAEDFAGILQRIATAGLDSTIAVKLSQLGLDVAAGEAEENLRQIVRAAMDRGNFVRIDMEESWRVDDTLRLYRALRTSQERSLGVVLQAYLRRSPDDLRALAPLEPNVRLVKGAYLEPEAVAFTAKRDIDRAYVSLIEAALSSIPFTAVATHDEDVIEETIALARKLNVRVHERLEFQMLLGVREALQARLVARGFPLRISVPFGADWYPYLMRRMAENPKNLALILRNW